MILCVFLPFLLPLLPHVRTLEIAAGPVENPGKPSHLPIANLSPPLPVSSARMLLSGLETRGLALISTDEA